MVDVDQMDAEEKTVLKLLKSFYKLVIARPDKSIFIEDPAFSVTITTYIQDDRPNVMSIMSRILKALTDSPKNCKLVAALPDFEQKLARQVEKENLSPKVVHELLVVQSRITALKVPKTPQSASKTRTFLKTAGTKQLVYQLHDNSEEKQTTLQERSIPIKGVVSLCFGAAGPAGDHHHNNSIKCIYRVQETLEAKILERCIFNCGYQKIQRVVRLDDGSTQSYDIYRDEVFTHTDEETKAKTNCPQYLDDNVMIFDPTQTLVPNNHAINNESSWFSGVKAYLPFW
jgi:hypothetical protein